MEGESVKKEEGESVVGGLSCCGKYMLVDFFQSRYFKSDPRLGRREVADK